MHTKGPWTVDEDAITYTVAPEWDTDTGKRDVVETFMNMGGENSNHDAILLAAAPTLVRAVLLGIQMRHAQRTYFADRTPDNLRLAKGYETAFDRAAAAIVTPLAVDGVLRDDYEGVVPGLVNLIAG